MASFTRWLGRPLERRSSREVAADAREEFELHLELLRAELERDGGSLKESELLARARFGDPDAYVRRCCEVTLKERHMVQRLTLLAVLVLVVGMVGLFVSTQRSQARTAEAIEQLSAAMASRTEAPVKGEAGVRRPAAKADPIGTVAITGKVKYPGAYAMADGLSMRRLAAAAGVDLQHVGRVRIARAGPTGKTAVVQELAGKDLGLEGPDVSLMNGDIVSIE